MNLKLVVEKKYMIRTFKMRVYNIYISTCFFASEKLAGMVWNFCKKNAVMDHLLLQQAGQHRLQNCCPPLFSKVLSMHV